MKQPVEIDFFAKVLFPSHLDHREKDLYFLGKRANLTENRYDSDLYRLRDGEAQRLTGSGRVQDYALCPEGIVFPDLREPRDREAAQKGEPLTVYYRLPYGGGEALELLRLPYQVVESRWLPDGALLFRAVLDHDLERHRAAAEGDGEKALKAKREADGECLVADELPFWANGDGWMNKKRVCLYLWDGRETRLLSDPWANAGPIVLSPSGDRALISLEHYREKAPLSEILYEVDLPGGTLRALRAFPGGTFARYTFAGERVMTTLYPKDAPYGLMVGNPRLYRAGPEDAKAELLEDSGLYNYEHTVGTDLALGASNRGLIFQEGKLYCQATLAGDSHLMIFDPESRTLAQVTREPGAVLEAVPYASGFALIAMRENRPPEVYTLSLEGGETRQSHLNDALLSETDLAEPEEFSFTNREGVPVHGWVLRPSGPEGERFPTLLDIHGGPKTAYGPVLFHEMQYWRAQGYGVLFLNPTGSDGRGEVFADLRGRYGGVDYDDLMDAVDAALDRFAWIDPDRLGVTGGSYGGFMTNWIIGHTDRFKAAASQRSISNWLGFCNTSDIGYFFGPDQMAATPWSDPKKLWEHSPLCYADRVRTPTLFIHSEEDYRCNQFEGIQMYSALRDFGVPARLCLFRGENHELSRSGKPKNRIRRLREITEWMDRYVKANPARPEA